METYFISVQGVPGEAFVGLKGLGGVVAGLEGVKGFGAAWAGCWWVLWGFGGGGCRCGWIHDLGRLTLLYWWDLEGDVLSGMGRVRW